MKELMIAGYLLFLLIGVEMTNTCVTMQSQEYIQDYPSLYKPYGVKIFSYIFLLFVLISSIWYLGWIAGIVVTILSFLSIIHGVFSWIISLPFVIYSRRIGRLDIFSDPFNKFGNLLIFELNLWLVVIIISYVFLIISFFVTPFRIIQQTALWNLSTIIYILCLGLTMFVLRIFAQKRFLR